MIWYSPIEKDWTVAMSLGYDNLAVYRTILCRGQKLAAVVEVRRCHPKTCAAWRPRLGGTEGGVMG